MLQVLKSRGRDYLGNARLAGLVELIGKDVAAGRFGLAHDREDGLRYKLVRAVLAGAPRSTLEEIATACDDVAELEFPRWCSDEDHHDCEWCDDGACDACMGRE